MLGFRVQSRGRFVEDEHEGPVAHEPARERELLPLPETRFDTPRPRRPELRLQPGCEAADHVLGPGPIYGGGHCRLVVLAGDIAHADRLADAELEAEEILERTGGVDISSTSEAGADFAGSDKPHARPNPSV